MEPLVGHLEIQYSITEQCDKLSDRGFNRMQWGHTEAIMNQAVGEEAVLGPILEKSDTCAESKDAKKLFGQNIPQGKGHSTKTQKGWTVTFTENCKQFHRTGADGVKGEWGDGRGLGRVLGRTTLKIRLEELTVYREDEGKSLQDFKQGVPQSNRSFLRDHCGNSVENRLEGDERRHGDTG